MKRFCDERKALKKWRKEEKKLFSTKKAWVALKFESENFHSHINLKNWTFVVIRFLNEKPFKTFGDTLKILRTFQQFWCLKSTQLSQENSSRKPTTKSLDDLNLTSKKIHRKFNHPLNFATFYSDNKVFTENRCENFRRLKWLTLFPSFYPS